MATNRQVSIATLERLLRNKENPHTRLPITKLRLDELGEDSTSKILQMYEELVNKPKNIAEKLIETIKSGDESERERARDILGTITDIETIKKIDSIIAKTDLSNDRQHYPIFYLLYERIIELQAVEKHQKKLEELSSIVETLKSLFKSKAKQSESDEKIKNLKTKFSIIKKEQNNAKKLLNLKTLKTLRTQHINWDDRIAMIEDTVNRVKVNVMEFVKLLKELR